MKVMSVLRIPLNFGRSGHDALISALSISTVQIRAPDHSNLQNPAYLSVGKLPPFKAVKI